MIVSTIAGGLADGQNQLSFYGESANLTLCKVQEHC
jgi:hypothetical protein